MTELTGSRPGHFWCDTCRDWIPDVFTDHLEQHTATAIADKLNGDVIAFWATCFSLGVVAAFLVDAISTRL